MTSAKTKAIPLTLEVIDIYGSTGDENRGLGKLTIEHHRPDQILFNAFKKLLLYWLIAIFCIFIPVLHFVLVPVFFILGFYMFRKSFGIKARIVRGELQCPKCRSTILIGSGPLNWPLSEICQSCVNTVRIRPTHP